MESIKEAVSALKNKLCEDKKKTLRIACILLIIAAAFLIKVNANSSRTTEETALPEHTEQFADISGAVNNPGIYEVNSETRLYELIEMAGGLKENADLDSINQAEFVEDGQKIIIPTLSVNDIDEYGGEDSSGLININTADKSRLTELSGIGDVIAQRIIEYRTQNRFKSIEEIKNVKGIGDSIYQKISGSITV